MPQTSDEDGAARPDGIIWRGDARGVVLRYSTEPSSGLKRLLSRTVWGDADIKYRVLGVSSILSDIPDPHYITLEEGQAVIGGMVCGRKRTSIRGRTCTAIHIAMIAIDPDRTGHGYGPLLAKRSKPFLFELMGGTGVIYLYIEATHQASIELHRRLGYRDVCRLDARIFARLAPTEPESLRTIDDTERDSIVRTLNSTYSEHALVDFEQSLLPKRYYVLGEPGHVRCGAQISEMRWGLVSLPGPGGYFALNVLPRIPGLSGNFRPTDFRFLRVSNVLPPTTRAQDLDRLLEGCLASHGVNAAMLFVDPRSPVQQDITSKLQFGLVDRLVGGKVQVLADFADIDDADIEWFTTQPLIVSPMDAI